MAYSMQSELLSQLSHELRNPLTLISSNLQLIAKRYPELSSLDSWNCILEDLHFVHLILNDVSCYERREKLSFSTFSFRDFMHQISTSFAASVQDTSVDFVSCIPSSLPPVSGDEVKLREVFLNLLLNAKDAAGMYGEIKLSVKAADRLLLISVEDNGCGISSEQLNRIFQPFVTYKKNGTGLGLPLCKSIVELHHGSISIKSIEHVGTVVTVSLPVSYS